MGQTKRVGLMQRGRNVTDLCVLILKVMKKLDGYLLLLEGSNCRESLKSGREVGVQRTASY